MSSTRINDLSETTSLASADQVPVYSQANGTRRMSLTTLAAFLAGLVQVTDTKTTQYSAPAASPFSVTVQPVVAGGSVWLVLTPTGTMAAGTINLPPSGTAMDRQEVLVSCTQIVTALTVSATGLNVVGAPTTLTAGKGFRMRFEAVAQTWYRVDGA